jgi:DNA-nicking Smr family endonuclease
VDDPDPVELPIDGVLDLHSFAPGEVGSLVAEYLDVCRERGVLDVRIVHGKGTGALRRSVRAILERRADVERFSTADEASGGWGATLVRLRPPAPRRG